MSVRRSDCRRVNCLSLSSASRSPRRVPWRTRCHSCTVSIPPFSDTVVEPVPEIRSRLDQNFPCESGLIPCPRVLRTGLPWRVSGGPTVHPIFSFLSGGSRTLGPSFLDDSTLLIPFRSLTLKPTEFNTSRYLRTLFYDDLNPRLKPLVPLPHPEWTSPLRPTLRTHSSCHGPPILSFFVPRSFPWTASSPVSFSADSLPVDG